MNIEEIKEAISIVDIELYTLDKYLNDKQMENLHGSRFRKMISCLTTLKLLAEQFIALAGKTPSKAMTYGDRDIKLQNEIHAYNIGYNNAIDDCTLATVGMFLTAEEIRNLIKQSWEDDHNDNGSLGAFFENAPKSIHAVQREKLR